VLILSAGKILKNPFGGEDLFSRHLSRWLATLHQEITLMGIEFAGIRVRNLTYDNVNDEQVAKLGKKVSKASKSRFGYLLYSLRTVIWLCQVLRILSISMTDPINIIHAQDSGYTGLAAIIAGKILRIPVIITLHGIRYSQIEQNPYVNSLLKRAALKIERRLDAFTLSKANIVTIVSPTMKCYVTGVAPESIVASIPVAIREKNFEFSEEKRELIRKELGIEKQCRIIGYVGRLSYEKNLNTLLHSFSEAVKYDSTLILILVGEGPIEMELRKQTRDLNIESKVIFCGFRNDIHNILSSFDIFILPSYIEGTSNALIEAMMCGCAIVCSDIPGNRELVSNNSDALLVRPDDPVGFKDAILLLLGNKTLRDQLQSNVKMKGSQYDEDIVFPKYLQYYQDLCRKS
jgi:glycosyltransferase involved in cell wall biosynthesis